MKLALEKLIPTAFFLAIVLLIILGVFAYRSVNAINTAIAWEIHTQEVLQKLNNLLFTTVSAEAEIRGYVITRNKEFLEIFDVAEPQTETAVAELKQLISDSPPQLERLARLEKLLGEKFRILKETKLQIETDPAKFTANTKGKEAMDKIRVVAEEMKSIETALLREREKEINNTFSRALFFLMVVIIAGIILLTLANILIFIENRKRTTAESELQNLNCDLEERVAERTKNLEESNTALRNSEEFNRSIFESSPDCVKVLDLDGNLLSMSKVGMCIMEIDDFQMFVGNDWKKFWKGENEETVFETIKSAAAGNTGNFVGACDTAKGTPKFWEVSVGPIYNAEGKVVRLISVSRDITERRAIEAEREKLFVLEKEARHDAEAANRMRDEFLATVSHELRNPLNAILGWGRLLQKDQLDRENKRKAVETIVRNAEAQNRLIEDLLDVSQIIAGKLRLDVSTINPGEFVEAAIDTVRPAADAKNIKINSLIDEELNKISGDASRLQQVIWNLLLNAIKFTPKNGEVSIAVASVDSLIEITVKDNGAGIAADFLPHVFDRFRQADASTVRKFGGLGLGLAIVRHIMEMHGGTVEVSSAGEGKGAAFTVKLPITAIIAATEEVLLTSDAEVISLIKEPRINLKGLFILAVDDDPDTCLLLSQVLTHYGAKVETVLSAAQAMDEFLKQPPDLLISDIGMPEEDGYALIRKIRALSDDKTKQTPAIALTAFARPIDRMKALAAGFQTHVSKPVEPDELATVIASLTGRLATANFDTNKNN